ncbi:MAG TPA: TlpA disulfide reductase family protein [Bryobacteraceae bacterium]|nr:TlpA disulfide reductase family protein [Bryobacteraceae bacterium]
MKKTTDWLLLGSIVLLGAALVWVVGGTLQPKITNAGDTAPNFKVLADDGKTITRSDFGGKLLVLNFWASWCPPCVAETPSLEQFAKEFAPQGVVVVGVSSDTNADRYHQFIKRYGISFETAMDPSADISASYGTFQIPETYIIDRNGKVLEKVISDQNWMDPEFLARIRKML